ncbi:MAG: xanthine dehydrogenase family protein molybdopterin-binding subunit [Actinomycetia bacterium]|nr:xanthine dehydrogenase family protein molybdopterin-binding subunit [Actinomycetes bacterium]
MSNQVSASVRDRALGRARYAADLVPSGAAVADVVRSPHPHARVVAVDSTEALQTPGVLGVLTPDDFAGVTIGRLIADEPPLASTARYVGDGVAAVAAVDHKSLLAGIAALRIEYEILAHATTTEQARTLSVDIHNTAPGNIASSFSCEQGDWDAAIGRVVEWAEGTFENAPVPHAYLEPRATVVRVADDHLELVTATHFPTALEEDYREIVRPWGTDLRIITPEMGGSFGAKWEHPTHLVCLAFAHRLGRDVVMVTPRRDDMIAGRGRLGMKLSVAIGADADGRLVAKRSRVESDNGAYSGHGSSVTVSAAIRADNIYRYEAVRASADLVYTNTMPSECFRGFGHPQAVFAQEQLIDELASKLGLSPAEIRRRNAVAAGDVTIHGWQIGSSGLQECIDEIETRIEAHRAAQTGAAQTGTAKSNSRFRTGYGLATCIHSISSRAYDPRFDRDDVKLTPRPDGTITINSGEVEIGCGANETLRTIVAEELGVAREILQVVFGDTEHGPYGLGNFASRTTLFAGRAAIDACRQLRRRCAEVAASLGLAETSVAEVIGAAALTDRLNELVVTGRFEPDNVVLPESSAYGNLSPAYNFAAHGCCVRVDTWTGKVVVQQYWAAHDPGHLFNPPGAHGQVIGAVTQGLGMALTEALELDPDGMVLNPGFLDDRVPTFPDAVPIEVIFIDIDDPAGPWGAKTIGEPPLIPVPACVANAIHDAVGVRLRQTPMTSERTWQALATRETMP